ncbi:MAG: DUF1282 family protein [Verrucomicrobia bacterium]|nr:DUF1282 family protein [Verrucomicrobiota bacterium]
MFTAFQLIFAPFRTWERISLARRRAVWILAVYLLPLLLVVVSVEAFSLARWGEKRSGFEFAVPVRPEAAIRYAITQMILLLGSILAGGKFLQWVTHSFQVDSSYQQCFSLMAYGFSPILLARLLDAVPAMNTWACWAIGALLSTSVLYHGVALVLRPEQTKGFGMYIVGSIIGILSSLLSHFVALSVLRSKVFYLGSGL